MISPTYLLPTTCGPDNSTPKEAAMSPSAHRLEHPLITWIQVGLKWSAHPSSKMHIHSSFGDRSVSVFAGATRMGYGMAFGCEMQ